MPDIQTSSPSPPASVEALGLRGGLFLAALLHAQQQRIPVAPTHAAALQVMDALQAQMLIQVPWPSDRWTIRPDAQDTPIEGLQWAFTWTTHDPTHLLMAVEEQLQDWAGDAEFAVQRRALWDELARWESELFLEQQLLKHRFDARWARDIGFVFASAPGLPIARWRYCCWAAVRQGGVTSILWTGLASMRSAGGKHHVFEEGSKPGSAGLSVH
ncbi:hypothetical protein [Pseudoxanthomonas mexicana]